MSCMATSNDILWHKIYQSFEGLFWLFFGLVKNLQYLLLMCRKRTCLTCYLLLVHLESSSFFATQAQGKGVLPCVALAAAGCIHQDAVEGARHQVAESTAIQSGHHRIPSIQMCCMVCEEILILFVEVVSLLSLLLLLLWLLFTVGSLVVSCCLLFGDCWLLRVLLVVGCGLWVVVVVVVGGGGGCSGCCVVIVGEKIPVSSLYLLTTVII